MRFLNNAHHTSYSRHIIFLGTHLSFMWICVLVFLVLGSKPSYASVVINEFDVFASPQTVELMNVSDHAIDVSGWYIDDSGGSTYLVLPAQDPVPPHACLIARGNIFLNTSTPDTIRLYDATANPTSASAHLVDSYPYTSFTSSGNSYARIPDGTGAFSIQPSSIGRFNVSQTDCTSGLSNSPTPIPTPTFTWTPSPSLTPTPTPTPTHTPTPLPTNTLSFTPTATIVPRIYLSEIMVNPSADKEWVELYNDSLYEQSLVGWMLDDIAEGGGSPVVINGIAPAFGYFVVSMPSNIFNNTGDTIRLIDPEGTEVEVFVYTNSQIDTSWGKTSFNSPSFCLQLPSKGMDNYPCLVSSVTPSLTQTATPSPPSSAPVPSGIYLSELYVNPENDEREWIEIYNDNRFEVTLEGWNVKDATGKAIASVTMIIPAYRYGVVELSSARMNNSNERIILLNPASEAIDQFSYETSEQRLSWGRSSANFGSWCLQTPSKNGYNSGCIVRQTSTPTATKTPTPPRSHTPTSSPRLGIGVSNSSQNPGEYLGAHTNTLLQTETLVLNYTPKNVISPTLPIMAESVSTKTNSTTVSISSFAIVGYLCIMGVCMTIGGFQLARLWELYRNLPTEYPDMFG